MSDVQKPMVDPNTAADVPKGPSLLDLPPEVLLEGMLPLLPLRDLFAISQVNKELNTLSVGPLPHYFYP